MYTPESIKQLVDTLEGRMQGWTTAGNYKLAITCGQALDALIEWRDKGAQSDIPHAVRQVPEVDVDGILVKATSAPEPSLSSGAVANDLADDPADAVPTHSDRREPADRVVSAVPISQSSANLVDELDAIEAQIRSEDFPGAEVRLSRLMKTEASAADNGDIKRVQQFLQARKRKALTELEEAARSLRRDHPDDLAGLRAAWNRVLILDPVHHEASQALARLDTRELRQDSAQELQAMRRDLRQIRTEIGKVEEARRQITELRYDPDLQLPESQREIDELSDRLDEFRNAILRVSEGGASMERAQNYDDAIKKYREATQMGLSQIVDDVSGEYIDPAARLKETIIKRDADYINRSAARYDDAKRSLRDGAPEAAVQKLDEAHALLNVVETGGDEWRARVTGLLEDAKGQVQNKGQAAEKVSLGDRELEPRSALAAFIGARDLYPSYPRLAERIAQKEELLVEQVLRNMRIARSRVESLLADRDYGAARREAEKMLGEGSDLDFIPQNEKVQQQRREGETLLDRITEEQRNEQRFQERLASIKKALEIPDARLATSFLDSMPSQDQSRHEVNELRIRIAQLGGDSEKWQAAENAFSQGDFPGVIKLCQELGKSTQFQERAVVLERRAQVRLWDSEARKYQERGQLIEAQSIYDKIRNYQGQLPEEDRPFIDQASATHRALGKKMEDAAQYEKDLADVRELRYKSDWPGWLKKLKELEEAAGDLLKKDLAEERESGMPQWQIDVVGKVERLLSGSDEARWTKAFELMHPLYMEGAIEDDDPRYRQVAYNAHSYEAERLGESDNPVYIKMQVDHLRELLKFAVPPAKTEGERLVAAVRRRALREAAIKAAQSGGKEAVKVLTAAIDENEYELTHDVAIRGNLVRYALQDGDFDAARASSEAIRYIPGPGMADLARSWKQLANAVEFFQKDDPDAWEMGANGVEDARRLNNPEPVLQESLDRLAGTMADRVYVKITQREASTDESDILKRVRLYAIVLKLRPGEPRAKAGIDTLATFIERIGRRLNDESRKLNQDGIMAPSVELGKLKELESQMATLVGAFDLLKDADANITTDLRRNMSTVRKRIDGLQTYATLMESLQDQYEKAMTQTWQTKLLDSVFGEAEKSARMIDMPREFSEWQEKVAILRDVLMELNQHIAELERSWADDRFSGVVDWCDKIDESLRQGQRSLKDSRLKVPAGVIDLHDPVARSAIKDLDGVRRSAKEKQQNLEAWEGWIAKFTELQKSSQRLGIQIERQVNGTPPCISEAKKSIGGYINQLDAWINHMGSKPDAAYSKQAKNYEERSQRGNLVEEGHQLIEAQKVRLQTMDRAIKDLDKPIADLKRFLYGNVNMRHAANVATFHSLAAKIYTVDDCHEEWLKLKARYKNLTGKEFTPYA